MSKEWGGRRANSGRHKVTQKVQYLRYPILKPPDSPEVEELLKWWKDRKPERRTALLLEMIRRIKNSEPY